MNQQPDSIIIEIFSYLTSKELVTKLALVSKKWRCLSYDSSLWREIRTDEFSSINIQDSTVLRFINYAKTVKTLSLRGCYQISNKVLRGVSINGSQLQYLNLENCFKITDRGIITLSRACQNLRTVNTLNTLITEHGLSYLLQENKNLIELTSAPHTVSLKTIQILTSNCKHVEYLHVEQNEFTPHYKSNKFNQNRLVSLTNEMIELLATNCLKLQVLILRYPITSIDDQALWRIGHQCKRIECVEIGQKTHTAPISDNGVIALCTRSTNLLRLDLKETFITDFTLQVIAECCPSLEHLEFGNTALVSDLGVMSIMNHCHNLDSFCLRAGVHSRLTDLSIFSIAQSHCAHNLIKLSMNNWNITDFGLSVIAKSLPHLLYLSLEQCLHLTNAGLEHSLKFFHSIHSLELTGTKCITNDKELVSFARLLPDSFQSVVLQTRDLTTTGSIPCESITEDGCRRFNDILPECEIVFV